MKSPYLKYLPLLFLLLSSCDKNEEIPYSDLSGGTFNVYLIKSYEKPETSCQIINSTVVLEESPFLTLSDFKSYNSKTYTFTLTDEGTEAFKNMQFSVRGNPFAILVNNELIYTGYFWPIYSSLGCDAITIEPSRILIDKELRIQRGYPERFSADAIEDKRNDPAILEAFRLAKKLIRK